VSTARHILGDLYGIVEAIAAREDRSVSSAIRRLVRAGIEARPSAGGTMVSATCDRTGLNDLEAGPNGRDHYRVTVVHPDGALEVGLEGLVVYLDRQAALELAGAIQRWAGR